ncbi:SIMPL domain-containing protein [Halovenus halobia]|uniref:SIMPL domain-containing protein n=1 Tax=Halovenus halobia TaxID=3396622 RepID=UPI003F575F9F
MQRNSIGIGIALGIVLLVVSAGAVAAFGGADTPAATQTTPENSTAAADTVDRTIHVTATGDAEAEPDQAVVRVTVRAEADDVGTVRDELATGSADLTAALDDLGVEYETTSYGISEQYQREDRQVPTYEGTHRYEITADDPDLAGAMADAAAEAGAEIDSVSLTLSDQRRAELREEAIRDAMDDASQQASVIADEGGLEITAPSNVDASQRSYSPVAFDRVQAGGDGPAPRTEIASGAVTVSYDVDVTYTAIRK